MTSPLWRHMVMWHHGQHAQWIAHRQVPISCPLEPSRYVPSFASPKFVTKIITWWRHQWRHKSLIGYREEHADISYSGSFCYARSNSDKNCQRSILKKTRRAWQSQTWGCPAPQVRVQNQFQEDEIPLAVMAMADRMKKFSENTSTISRKLWTLAR